MRRRALAFAFAAVLASCGGGPEPIVGCDDAPGIHPICGFQNPEDLAVLPGGAALLVSEFGAMDGTKSGSLSVFEIATESRRPLFPAGGAGARPEVASGPRWGEPDCPPPSAAFSPHGIDLAERPGGGLQLLVVNHGGRESIELFEVIPEGTSARLEWRGCALPPEQAFLNDVVALPDGGFLVTHMQPKREGIAAFWQIVRGLAGFDTGHVYEWQPDTGFRVASGTEAPFPNGIEVSPDGGTIYLDVYLGSEVRKIDRKTGELLARAEVEQPDNVTWGDDGRLLVASHTAGLGEMMACGDLEQGACGFEFQIVSLDPETLESRVVVKHAGAPMGAGTVAVQVGRDLYVGSFAGDRIARFTPRGG
jgi:DNA-binding beta-propeller fold protein YncE